MFTSRVTAIGWANVVLDVCYAIKIDKWLSFLTVGSNCVKFCVPIIKPKQTCILSANEKLTPLKSRYFEN